LRAAQEQLSSSTQAIRLRIR